MSSKRAIRRKACTGKRRHLTADSGYSMIGSLNAKRGYQGRMNVYLCPFCRYYHIGHPSSQGKR